MYICVENHHPKGEGYGERLVLPTALPKVAYLTCEVSFFCFDTLYLFHPYKTLTIFRKEYC